jgi:hypothetical protein
VMISNLRSSGGTKEVAPLKTICVNGLVSPCVSD